MLDQSNELGRIGKSAPPLMCMIIIEDRCVVYPPPAVCKTHYIAKIRSSHLADLVEYSVIDDDNAWQLCTRTHAALRPRFSCADQRKRSLEINRRVLVRSPHGMFTVLKE